MSERVCALRPNKVVPLMNMVQTDARTCVVCFTICLVVEIGVTFDLTSGVPLLADLLGGNVEALLLIEALTQRHVVTENSNVLWRNGHS